MRLFIIHNPAGLVKRGGLILAFRNIAGSRSGTCSGGEIKDAGCSGNPSRVEETVTEVLKQFTQDGDFQAGMSLESLQQKVEFTLKYSEGSLSKWKNCLSCRLREFYKSNNPASVYTTLTWELKVPQPVRVPKHRPCDGMVWNDTGNPIVNEHGIVLDVLESCRSSGRS